jgi:hypothetical protein
MNPNFRELILLFARTIFGVRGVMHAKRVIARLGHPRKREEWTKQAGNAFFDFGDRQAGICPQ